MSTKQCPPVTLGPWPKGMNNRASEFDLPEKTLRDAYNVDITNNGRARRRRGSTLIETGSGRHSVFAYGSHFLFVRGDQLRYGLPPSAVALRQGLTLGEPMYYTVVNEEIYFSNGIITGKIQADGSLVPWGVLTPISSPVVSATGAGALQAGRYQVAVVHVSPTGEESGARAPAVVDVGDGGGIQVLALPQSVDGYATTIRVYRSQANGEVLYWAADYAMGTVSATLGASVNLGRPLSTLFMEPMVPCKHLTSYNGRIYGAVGNAVVYTEPLRYGLTQLDRDFLLLPKDVNMLLGVRDGIFAGSDITYFMAGAQPSAFDLKEVLPFAPVPGTPVTIKPRLMVAWFSEKGYVIGTADGQAKLATEPNIAVPTYESGAVLYREDRGLRQLVGAFNAPVATQFEASDFDEADTVRSVQP